MSTAAKGSLGAAAALLLVCGFFLGVPVIAVAAGTNDTTCSPGGTAQTVVDQQLDAEQMGNAATIVQVVQTRGLPQRAAVIALATAYQESKLRNVLVAVDHDSLGLFQQRVMDVTAAVAADPVKATDAFLDGLMAQPSWQTRPLTDIAADVQRPAAAARGLYAQWEPLATQLTSQLWNGTFSTTAGTGGSAQPETIGGTTGGAVTGVGVGTVVSTPCAGQGGDGGDGGDGGTSGPASSTPGPNGLTLTGSAKGDGAVQFAMAQIGKPYLWGGAGPNAWDCSGLTQAAWASQGIPISRVTYTQMNDGSPVALADARSGDLVLIPGSDGTATNPGHVGMVAGTDTTGKVWLVEAPRTGLDVRLTPLSSWMGQIVTIRRIG